MIPMLNAMQNFVLSFFELSILSFSFVIGIYSMMIVFTYTFSLKRLSVANTIILSLLTSSAIALLLSLISPLSLANQNKNSMYALSSMLFIISLLWCIIKSHKNHLRNKKESR